MRDWDARRIAVASGAELVVAPGRAPAAQRAAGEPGRAPGRPDEFPQGPGGVSIDSRTLAPGELFVGLRGEHTDGGEYAAQALRAGAWGVLVAPAQQQAAIAAARAVTGEEGAVGSRSSGAERTDGAPGAGAVLVHEDPLRALQALALQWRRRLGAGGTRVIAITGSTGKTSTKDILAAMLAASMRVAATPANLNTEIGLPLALLRAPVDTQVVVLEMAMRGAGQIAQLTAIAEPDVGVIVNVGPAHLERLGSLQAIAAAKAELIAGLAPGASVVVPADEPLLAAYLRADLHTITFGEGGEVSLAERRSDGTVLIEHAGERIELRPSFSQAHHLRNLLAAVAAARALGYTPHGELQVRFSAMRGQLLRLPGGVMVIDDCYNANPMSVHAAIDELVATAAARRVAVLGDMLELGPSSPALHREIGSYARAAGVDVLVTVGELAAQMSATFAGESHAAVDAREASELVEELLREGDTVLVKGSRGVHLEQVIERLRVETRTSAAVGQGRR
ncbi:MAG TPA: UDP-N-acetylmuramoyl-tripeptide--D-alanyl-D-alanine ligase [Solirubrobacteraceae bacterium]|nr:UDP-N-acetylmuramoyl-tripeptide--D-alanyl-D-alanine ligase [Solirubrobacteraceae bacterium]